MTLLLCAFSRGDTDTLSVGTQGTSHSTTIAAARTVALPSFQQLAASERLSWLLWLTLLLVPHRRYCCYHYHVLAQALRLMQQLLLLDGVYEAWYMASCVTN